MHIMFGARQTGKATLIRNVLPADALVFDLSDTSERARFAAAPGRLIERKSSTVRRNSGIGGPSCAFYRSPRPNRVR